MASISVRSLETLQEVLARFTIVPEEVRDIRSGRVNRHWRVVTRDGGYVLRRYRPQRTAEAVSFEHALLDHVAERGWPVARAVPTPAGETWVSAGGARYALFPLLPGRPAPYNNLRYLRLKGRLLARLHHDMASWAAPGQREGFGRLWELDVFVGAETGRSATLNELLRGFARAEPELARAVRVQKYASLRELARLGYGELPAAPVHCDFHHDNLLFSRGELSGLLDFDHARLDARVADIAASISLDCLAPPAHNEIDAAAVRAFVSGYVEFSPLSEVELRLIVPLVWAFILWGVAHRLVEWAETAHPRAMKSIQRSVTYRFPGLERRRAELEAAVTQAAAEAAR